MSSYKYMIYAHASRFVVFDVVGTIQSYPYCHWSLNIDIETITPLAKRQPSNAEEYG